LPLKHEESRMLQEERTRWPAEFWRAASRSDVCVLLLIAAVSVFLRSLINGQYGFHRDELLTYTNARHLDWGYVSYPPMTAFLARIEMEVFGASLRGFRFFGAVAQSLMMLFAGLSARELGGSRSAQILAAIASGIGGVTLVHGSFYSYTAFDQLSWILVAYFIIRLLKSENPRWWLAVGASIGLGMMAKYSIAFLTLGLLGGLVLTPVRRHLRSPWPWCGAALAVLIVLPNLLWQMQHHFVSLDCLRSIHQRDIARGWTDYFLLNQLWKTTNFVAVPLWLAGLWYLFRRPEGKRYRIIGWMYVITLVALAAVRGRDYYLAPAYPMLIAAGAVWGEQWVNSLSLRAAARVRRSTWISLACATLCASALTLPIAPLNSSWWRVADGVNGNFNMEIGWPEMVETVARIRDSLPAEERARIAILAGDEGEAGAINLYGPAYGLPEAISGMNSNWYRGYGDWPAQTVITLGEHRDFLERNFESCVLAGHVTNRYGIVNFAVAGWDEIFVCRRLRWPWPEFWKRFQYFG
jgi:4-amino-4-deoxy-L-arabinose transferase-like glycosyltransferase